jgi:hypothetical protein
MLIAENVVAIGSSVVARRDAIVRAGGFDPAFSTLADHDAWIRIALLRPRNVYALADCLTLYRIREGQMSGNWRGMRDEWDRLEAKLARLAPAPFGRVSRRARAGMRRHAGYLAYEASEYGAAARLLLAATRMAPSAILGDRRAWVLAAALLGRLLLPASIHSRADRVARRVRRALWKANLA